MLVFSGGAAGSLTRYVITAVTPGAWGQPAATFVINIVGAFALGWLLEALLRRPGDPDRQTRSRLLLGTGFLGGFTTYSALAVDSVVLGQQGPLAGRFRLSRWRPWSSAPGRPCSGGDSEAGREPVPDHARGRPRRRSRGGRALAARRLDPPPGLSAVPARNRDHQRQRIRRTRLADRCDVGRLGARWRVGDRGSRLARGLHHLQHGQLRDGHAPTPSAGSSPVF